MFSIFKRKKKDLITDINWLGVDIHSHLLPGIDDGAESLEQSLGYIKHMQELGFEKLICTPHIFTELYPNTKETIMPALQLVKDGLVKDKINIEMGAAAEYMVDDTFKVEDELLCLPNKYILIEMSYLSESPNIEQVIFDLEIKGYNIILAHPERYNFYHKDPQPYHRFKDMGCLFQLNLLSVLGYYGKGAKQAADYLIQNKFYDLAGTDLHHDRHLDLLEKNVRSGELYNIIGNYEFRNSELFGR